MKFIVYFMDISNHYIENGDKLLSNSNFDMYSELLHIVRFKIDFDLQSYANP